MKGDKHGDDDGMLPEYDFSKGVRGKHAAAFRKSLRLVVLDSDVARVFKDSREVNDALRALAGILKRHERSNRK